jgi:hypothetical protein
MKVNRLTWLVLLISLFTVSAAWCDVVADLMANDRELSLKIDSGSATDDGLALKLRENELFSVLLNDKESIDRFIEEAEVAESDIIERFYNRVRFEVAHERRSDLSFLVDSWHGEERGRRPTRSHKKIAMIYGCEVNLLDGQWRNSSDGRRFWVSNEYPDIVLSAAEYKKYFNSAATVPD